jgi:Ca2+-binding RTX toxin-like protein
MVNGTNQIDTLNGGNTSHDTIAGLNADDTIFGHGGNDKLFGGNGVDRLFGGDGADVLEGGNGDDRLDGGKGADILTGGLGADTFVFDRVDAAIANTGVDKITDFKVGTDDIWLGPGITVTNMTTAHVDANGHLDTILQLSNGGAIQVMDVSGLTHDQWLIIA